MNALLKLTVDYFVWLLGSFVALCDIVFDWCTIVRGVFIEQRFFYKRWLSFLFGGLVAVLYCARLIFDQGISFTSTSTFIKLAKSVQTSHQPTRAQRLYEGFKLY